MEAIAELDKDFARFEVVGAAEGEAVVEQHATVGNVEGLEIDGKALPKFLAKRKIKSGVRREVLAGILRSLVLVGEAGCVGNVGRGIGMPRQGELAAKVQRVALIVVEQAATAAEREISEAAVDAAAAERELIRISEINLAAAQQARRAEGKL